MNSVIRGSDGFDSSIIKTVGGRVLIGGGEDDTENTLQVNGNIHAGSGTIIANGPGGVITNTAIGLAALQYNTIGGDNIAIGITALYSNTEGWNNTAIGVSALQYNTIGGDNTAIGVSALSYNTTGGDNTAIGVSALSYNTTGGGNLDYSNCSGLGNDTRVSGSNQVQLGNSYTTTYCYGAVQNRSDSRDKTDITDTVLGLNFINKLRPVDFKWDMRDFYFNNVEVIETIEVQKTRIVEGVEETYTTTEEKKVSKLVPVEKDGSRAKNRKHHGIIAQEVKVVMDELGVDFAGYQDHSVNGGLDVLSIGYEEFIAPLIKAIQELTVRVQELEAR